MEIVMKEFAKNYLIREDGTVFKVMPNKTIKKLKNSQHGNGYLTVHINGQNKYVHRLVAETFIPNPENKKEVNHIDGCRSNNSVDNLEWVTKTENMKHAKEVLKKDWCMIRKPVSMFTSNGEWLYFNSCAEAERFLFGKRTRTIDMCIRKLGFYNKNGVFVCQK